MLTQHSYQRGDSKTNCAYLANCMLTQQWNRVLHGTG